MRIASAALHLRAAIFADAGSFGLRDPGGVTSHLPCDIRNLKSQTPLDKTAATHFRLGI
jgi:hypothetical protein